MSGNAEFFFESVAADCQLQDLIESKIAKA